MLRVARLSVVCLSALSMSACASLFSAYDSKFSCKNSDHGGCSHPLDAYEDARSELTPTFDGTPNIALVEMVEEQLAHGEHGHVLAPRANEYRSYQDASYGELEALIAAPDTPVLAPAKTVRTLILPYTDPKSSDRLYMPRYVYSVLENSRFVLGNYPVEQSGGLSLDTLIGAKNADDSEAKE